MRLPGHDLLLRKQCAMGALQLAVNQTAPGRGKLPEVEVPKHCCGAVSKLIEQCYMLQPSLRPSAKGALH